MYASKSLTCFWFFLSNSLTFWEICLSPCLLRVAQEWEAKYEAAASSYSSLAQRQKQRKHKVSFSPACFCTNLTTGQHENFKMPTVSTETLARYTNNQPVTTSPLKQPVSRYSSLCGIDSLILIFKKVNKQFFPEYETISCDYYQYYLDAFSLMALCVELLLNRVCASVCERVCVSSIANKFLNVVPMLLSCS